MPTQWSEAEQVPLGCIAPPLSHCVSGGQSRPPLQPSTERPPCFFSVIPRARSAGRRDVDPPHPRCSSVGGDAHIAPYAAAAPRHQASLVEREVSALRADGGIVIAGRGRAPPLHTSADSLCAIRAGGCGHPPLHTVSRRQNIFNQRPKAATHLCRFAAKARFDNRLTQGVGFPKGRGRTGRKPSERKIV